MTKLPQELILLDNNSFSGKNKGGGIIFLCWSGSKEEGPISLALYLQIKENL
jgi:hypothetical protein